MKKSLSFVVMLWLLTISFISHAQLQVVNTGVDVVTCGSPSKFAFSVSNDGPDLIDFDRQLILPAGLIFSWSGTQPAGTVLTYGATKNIMNIHIPAVHTGDYVYILYAVGAGCSASTGVVTPIISDVTGLTTNDPFNVIAGTAFTGSLLFRTDYQVVDGVATLNWGNYASTGETFHRSFKLTNNGSAVFNGNVNYANQYDATLDVNNLSYFNDLNNNGLLDVGSEVLMTADLVHFSAQSATSSFPVNALPAGASVIITEDITVLSCLDNGGKSEVSFSYGCTVGDACTTLLSNNKINTLRRTPSAATVVMTGTTTQSVCHYDGTTENKSITIANTGNASMFIEELSLWSDNIYNLGWNFSLIPVNTFSITITRANGAIRTISYQPGDPGVNSATFPYVNQSQYGDYPYPKCFSGPVFTYISGFLSGEVLNPGDVILVNYQQINCCPVAPDVTRPQDWRGVDYLYAGFTIYYHEECGGDRKAASVSGNTNSSQSLALKQSLFPYAARLAGGQRDPVIINTYKGDVTPIEVENILFTNSVQFSAAHSFIDIEIELEGGLTLTSPNSTFNGLNGRYDVAIERQEGAALYTLLPVNTVSPITTNQSPDDQINEKWVFRFSVNDPVILSFRDNHYPGYTMEQVLSEFIRTSIIRYKVRGVCTSYYGSSHFYTSVFFVPGDANASCGCRLPVKSINKDIIVTCPGCINPGIVLGSSTVLRQNVGEIDNNNNGIPDAAEGTVGADNIRRDFATQGDLLEVSQTFSFYPGDAAAGFDHADLRARGINLDQLYAVVNVPDGMVLQSADYVNSSGVSMPVVFVQLSPTVALFNVPESSFGVLPSSGGTFPMGRLNAIFKIEKNISNDVEIMQVDFEGLLSDKDIDITTLSSPVSLQDGTCNGLGSCVSCKDIVSCPPVATCPGGCLSVFYDRVQANTDNFYCEPGSSANFMFVPLFVDNAYGSFDGGVNGVSDPCVKYISFHARLYHPKVNAFPNEYRMYGSDIKYTLNVATNWKVVDFTGYNMIRVNSLGTDGWNYEYATVNTLVTPNPVEGEDFEYTIHLNRMTVDPTVNYYYNPSTANFHHQDERVAAVFTATLESTVCGPLSTNAKYSTDMLDYNKPGVFKFPFVDFLNFTIDEPAYNQNALQFSMVHYRPYLNLSASQLGNSSLNIGSANFATSMRVFNPDLVDNTVNKADDGSDIFAYFDAATTYRLDSKNTFVAVQGLPAGVTLASISKGGTVITDPNNDGIFEIGLIPGGITPQDLNLNFTYDCGVNYTNYPITVLYGWNCEGYPTSVSAISSTCFSGSLPYSLTTVPTQLSATSQLTPATATYCEEMEYRTTVVSSLEGGISQFSDVAVLPAGFTYVPNSSQADGVAVAEPVIGAPDPITGEVKLNWSSIRTAVLQNGASFTFTFRVKASCTYTTGGIKDTIFGTTYCGTVKSIGLPELTPSIVVLPSQYDQLSLSMSCSNVGSYTSAIDIMNTGSTATKNVNVLKLTYTNGITINPALTTGGYTVTGPNEISWILPSYNAGTSVGYVVGYSVSAALSCGAPLVLDAEVIGEPTLACGTEVCSFPKLLTSASCSTRVVRPVDVRPVTSICGSGCGTLTSLFPGNTGFEWHLNSLMDPVIGTAVSYNACTSVNAVYYVTSYDAAGCMYTEKFPMEVGYEYEIQDVNWICGSTPAVCVNVMALKDVTKPAGQGIIGMDFCINYPVGVLSPVSTVNTGNIGVVVKGTSYPAMYMINTHEPGKVHVSIYYPSNAPAGAQFAGTGLVMCVPFNVIGNPPLGTTNLLTMCEMYESYTYNERPVCWDGGNFTVVPDNQLRGYLTYRTSAKRLNYDASKTNHAVNLIQSNANCGASMTQVNTNATGSFTLPFPSGANQIKITRDINNSYIGTGVGPACTTCGYLNYVNAADTRAMGLITTLNKYECITPSNSCSVYIPAAMDMIAADVNMSDSVRANDITLTQRRIVYKIPEFPQVPNLSGEPSMDWRFIDPAFLSNTDYTLSASYPYNDGNGHYWRDNVPAVPSCLPIITQCRNDPAKQYAGILLGDVVNISSGAGYVYNSNPYIRTSTANDYKYVVDLNAATSLSGGLYSIPVYYATPDTTVAVALDFIFDYNEATVELIDVQENVNLSVVGSNLMWNDLNGAELLTTNYTLDRWKTGDLCYTILVRKRNTSVLNGNDVSGAFGMINGEWADVSILGKSGVTTVVYTGAGSGSQLSLEVVPNPVISQSSLNYVFSSASSGNAIVIQDVLGRTLMSYRNLDQKGQVSIISDGLISGSYFAIMTDGSNGLTKVVPFVITK